MTDKLIEQIKCDREAGTPGPWVGLNMIHAEGRAMTPEEVGEYVANSVRMGIEGRFLFVSGKRDDGGDCYICHTGNGPRGVANTARLARVPEYEARILADAEVIKAADVLVDWYSDLIEEVDSLEHFDLSSDRKALDDFHRAMQGRAELKENTDDE